MNILNCQEDMKPSEEKIDNNLAMSILLLDYAGVISGKQAEKTIYIGEEKEKNIIIKTCILSKILSKQLPVQKVFLSPNSKTRSKEIRNEMIEKR